MSSQGVMSSKETSNSPGLCLVKGQKSGIKSLTRAQNHLLSPSLSIDKMPPHYHMLVIYPAFYLFPYILLRNPQGRLWSNKVVNSSVSCKLVGNFISSYPRMSRYPKQPHRMLGGNFFEWLLALLYHWRCCFNSLKGFKSCLFVRANTNIFI
jgi:hypothetical protein